MLTPGNKLKLHKHVLLYWMIPNSKQTYSESFYFKTQKERNLPCTPLSPSVITYFSIAFPSEVLSRVIEAHPLQAGLPGDQY